MFPRCQRCGRQLRLRYVLRCLVQGRAIYVYTGADGKKYEVETRWLCARCRRRSRERAAGSPASPELASDGG